MVQGQELAAICSVDSNVGIIEHLGIQIGIVYLPDLGLDLIKQVGCAVIGQNQGTITIPNKIAVVAKLELNVLDKFKSYITSCGEIVHHIDLERFKIAFPRNCF